MSILQMSLLEILRRKGTFVLATIAVAIAAGTMLGASALLRIYGLRSDALLVRKEAELKKELKPHGVEITAARKELGEQQMVESNRVFINGEPVECIVPGVRVFLNDCESCCEIVSKEGVKCRAIEYNGKQYDELPRELIREAILAVARNLPRPPPPEPEAGEGCSG